MKINLVNDDQLQIIVTKNDMFGRDMRALFRDIIEQARLQFGFEVVHNTSLMVEAYPLSEESMILTITKINAEDVNFDLFVANGTVDEPWAVFEFGRCDRAGEARQGRRRQRQRPVQIQRALRAVRSRCQRHRRRDARTLR